MSEANVPPRHNSPNELDALAHADRVSAQQPPNTSSNHWETVPLPGTFSANEMPYPPERNISANKATTPREAELIALIQDLNRCNEVLLSRVNQLEEALETSQRSLQQEIERSQKLPEGDKVAIAQQHSVAQLLSELEQSNALLKRQTILAETVQAQLETHQERSKHLELECALLQKHHAEKSQKLQELEETCRDLRSRLQRQQRYTLQFKAALEKCLEAPTANPALAPRTNAGAIDPDRFDTSSFPAIASTPNPLAMPRSERIQPWSTTEATAQADLHLLSLVRSLGEPPESPALSDPSPSVAGEQSASPELAIEAEKQLWQDVERVIENSASPVESRPEGTSETSQNNAPGEAQFTEPLPWGTPIQKEAETPATPQTQNLTAQPLQERDSISVEGTTSSVESSSRKSDSTNTSVDSRQPPTSELPALDAANLSQTSPSPVVHPLRPQQKKRKSLSAVELPSFPPLPKPQGQGS